MFDSILSKSLLMIVTMQPHTYGSFKNLFITEGKIHVQFTDIGLILLQIV